MSEAPNMSRPTRWKRFWFLVKVVEVRLRFVLVLVVTGGLIGYWDVIKNHYDKYTRDGSTLSKAANSLIEFFCPMHPFVVRPEFGKCPICGMDLVPRTKGEEPELPEGAVARVQLSPMQVTEGGVRVQPVERRMLSHETRSVGVVETSEESEATIAARFPGRVEKLFVNFVGAKVNKNDPVAQIYSPKYLAATQEYLQALSSAGDGDRGNALVQAARQRLLLAGFTLEQIQEIAQKGKAEPHTTYYSPIAGTVMTKQVVEGQYVEEGEPLLSLADLGRVWVQVRVLESDLNFIRAHQPVEVRSVTYPGVVFLGTVNFIQPAVDPVTRTVNVRVEIQNPNLSLRPGMYVTARVRSPIGGFIPMEPPDTSFMAAGHEAGGPLSYDTTGTVYATGEVAAASDPAFAEGEWEEGYTCVMHPEYLQEQPGPCTLCNCGMRMTKWRRQKVLAVPERAVIDTGMNKFVYVESQDGVFDAHKVILGARTPDDYYPVLAGLKPGTPVATVGSFLIDAENRLNPASEINKSEPEEETPAGPTILVKGGFKPDRLVLEPGDPKKIVFDRREQGECTDEIVFPTLDIRVKLPPFEKTVVDLPTTATGEIPFACGMNMLHGTIALGGRDIGNIRNTPDMETTSAVVVSDDITTPGSPPIVTVDGGYKPDVVRIGPGEPKQVIFDRKDEGACTDEVVFPDLGIRVQLPTGKRTVVDLPTTASGEIRFACGMDMLHGKVLIDE